MNQELKNQYLLNSAGDQVSAVSAQLWPPKKCLQGPPNGGLKKMFSTLCYISRRNVLQTNTLIADTILAEPGT